MKKLGKFKVLALVLTLILALTMVGTGVAFALHTAHTTVVAGEVYEAFTVSVVSGDGTWDGGSWVVKAYPGETKTLVLKVSNAGSVALGATVSTDSATVTGSGWYSVPALGSVDITFTWVVPTDAIPGLMNNHIYIQR